MVLLINWWRIPWHRGIQRWKGVKQPGKFVLTHLHTNICYKEEKKVTSVEVSLQQDPTIQNSNQEILC